MKNITYSMFGILAILLISISCDDSLGIESNYRQTLIKEGVKPDTTPIPPPPSRFEFEKALLHFKEFVPPSDSIPQGFYLQWDTVIVWNMIRQQKIVIDTSELNWAVWLNFTFESPISDQINFYHYYRKDCVRLIRIKLDSVVMHQELFKPKKIILDGKESSKNWSLVRIKYPLDKKYDFTEDENIMTSLSRDIFWDNFLPGYYGKECIHGIYLADFTKVPKIQTSRLEIDFWIFY